MTKQETQIIAKVRQTTTANTVDTLLESVRNENNSEKRIIYALGACVLAAKEKLGLDAFDEQLAASLSLYNGRIIQMSTGEGKTLSAVFAAFLYVLGGRRVHILTFNDYLAKRDFDWMSGVYRMLGVNISYITEKSTKTERKSAYEADVCYVTAKECGFDFLRDFVAQSEEDCVHRGFDVAIVDEADSLLIDEARIPLVIAGNISVDMDTDMKTICEAVQSLSDDDYGISLETETPYLTDKGVKKIESFFGIENLYEEDSLPLRTKVNDCLKACFQLNENDDYIVKDNEIQLIDEFTGRIAKNRHYPGSLQAAVEAKHGLELTSRGTIMGTVPLQFFIRQYKQVGGMTGTALSSKEEFFMLYDLSLDVIPPHKPCIREDLPITVHYDSASKWNAIENEIIAVHKTRQPILVGTSSIDESETLASALREAGIDNIAVLNAKNDEMEAEIIKNAGSFGAVTISTNMAGRGVDIKLGGSDEKTRNEAVNAGGLYVIGTSMAESSRINDQLKGRSGRQGDPGKSKLYVALDDEIMLKYDLKKLVPQRHWPDETEEAITDKTVIREIERVQRISEGETYDERSRLLKFNMIGEKHRDIIFKKRLEYIKGETEPDVWKEYDIDLYNELCRKYGESEVKSLEKRIIIAGLNDFWCDYLEFTSYLREGIHLRQVGGENPSDAYNVSCENYFQTMEQQIIDYMGECMDKLAQMSDISEYTVKIPSGTWTYLLEDTGDVLNKKPFLIQAMSELDVDDLKEYEDDYSDDDEIEETEEQTHSTIFDDAPIEEKPAKKGFFGKMFSKK